MGFDRIRALGFDPAMDMKIVAPFRSVEELL